MDKADAKSEPAKLASSAVGLFWPAEFLRRFPNRKISEISIVLRANPHNCAARWI
jgi:hypothetical protein